MLNFSIVKKKRKKEKDKKKKVILGETWFLDSFIIFLINFFYKYALFSSYLDWLEHP